MTRVVKYARYSCDKQKKTSLDDQIRRCFEIFAQYRLFKNAVTIFSDEALSATGKDGLEKQA